MPHALLKAGVVQMLKPVLPSWSWWVRSRHVRNRRGCRMPTFGSLRSPLFQVVGLQ